MRKKIMIDVDDTIVENRYIDMLNEFKHTNYKLEDLEGYYVEEKLLENEYDDFRSFVARHTDIYKDGKLIDGAIEAIKSLNEEYEIIICSAFYNKHDQLNSASMLDSKFRFILNHLPFINPENIFFGTNKNILNCEIKIDDKVKNLKEDGMLKILLTQKHNLSFDDEYLKKYNIIRVKNWKEIKDLLYKGEDKN